MHSCLYTGRVAHHRYGPVDHGFQYPVTMAYIDLDEWRQGALGHLLTPSRYARIAWPTDEHVCHADGPLKERVKELVHSDTGMRLRGPIRLLTQLRCFGYYFSPLNLFYCYDADGREVDAVVAEVNNTPWNEQHHYVLWEGNRLSHDAGLRFRHPKSFHVSPFMQMEVDYRWRLSEPGDDLGVRIENLEAGEMFFEASMQLQRRPLTANELRRAAWRFPFMTGKIIAAIHWQALRLWWKRCPYHSHPKNVRPQPPVKAS